MVSDNNDIVSTQQSLARLHDWIQARQVLYRYCFAVDMGSVEDVMALFTDDCELEIVPGKLYRGREAVWQWYETLTTKRMEVLRHLAHNQVLDISGQSALSKSYWDAVGDLKGEAMLAAGLYEDVLRKLHGEWKLAKKVIKIDYMVPLSEGWGGRNRIKASLLREIPNDSRGWR
jgi:ketosteroid isomerase-like protein